jgi:uncharacterized cupredoxin-like copper-binding protein
MKNSTRGGIAAAMGLALLCATATFGLAAGKMQVIHVSLGGEAGQPMTIKLDADTGKAGDFEFDVKNDAIGTDHEVVLVKLKNKGQKIEADPKMHRIDEAKLKSMGEVAVT